jgi:hypothetical protein
MDGGVSSLSEMTLFASARAQQRTCDKQHPTLDLTYNCSASAMLPGLSARLLQSDKS